MRRGFIAGFAGAAMMIGALLMFPRMDSGGYPLSPFVRRADATNRLGIRDTSLLRIFKANSSAGLPVNGDLCDAFASELTGNYFCLRGDGTQRSTAGMTLSASGSPTTDARAECSNGPTCAPTSAQRLTSTAYYATGTVASPTPTSDFSLCVVATKYTANNVASWVLAYDSGSGAGRRSGLRLDNSVGAVSMRIFTDDVGTSTDMSASSAQPFAPTIACGTYHYVGAGTVNEVRLYVNGAQVGSVLNSLPIAGVVSTQSWRVGSGTATFDGRMRNAFYTEKLLSASTIAAMNAIAFPTPTGTRGEVLTFTRATTKTCTAPDGTITVLPNNRTCVTGVDIGMNLLTYSEQMDNAIWFAVAGSVAPDATTDPLGGTTADVLSFTAASFPRLEQRAIISNGGSYTMSAYAKLISGSLATAQLQIWDNTSSSVKCSANLTLTTNWQRYSCTVTVTVGDVMYPRATMVNGSGQTGSISVWGAQLESDSVLSPYVSTTSAPRTAAVSNSGGIVVEPAASTMVTNTDTICSTGWSINGGTGTCTASTWDYGEGIANGVTINDTDAANEYGRRLDVAVVSSAATTYTASAYFQAGTTDKVILRVTNPGGWATGQADCVLQGLNALTVRRSCTNTYTPNFWPGALTAASLNVIKVPSAGSTNGHYYKATTGGTTGASEPSWCTAGGCTVADGSVVWTEQGLTQTGIAIIPGTTATDTGSVKVGGPQLELGPVATSLILATGSAAPRAADAASVATPAGFSATEGCVKACFIPSWTGANPSSNNTTFIGNNGINTGDFLDVPNAGGATISSGDGAGHGANATASFVAGVKLCGSGGWSATTGFMTAKNITTGATATGSAGFTTEGTLTGTIRLGGHTGTGPALPMTLSDIMLGAGSNAGACQ